MAVVLPDKDYFYFVIPLSLMRIPLTLFFTLLLLQMQAQHKEPNYSLLKPYFTKYHTQTFTVGISSDSLYASVVFYSDAKKPLEVQSLSFPFLVLSHKDSLFYIHQRTNSYNEKLIEVYGDNDTVQINFYRYYSLPIILNSIKDAYAQAAYDKSHQEKQLVIESSMSVWDEMQVAIIEHIIPGYVQLGTYYEGYTGGAHPNHFSHSVVQQLSDLIMNGTNEDGYYEQTESRFRFIDVLSSPNIDSVRRVLFFKGIAKCFDDMYFEDTCIFNLKNYEGKNIFDAFEDAEYIVDVNEVNALLQRRAGYYEVYAEAYADASYAESGDYQFTAGCGVGRLPKTLYPHTNATLTLSILQSVDPSVLDYYPSEDGSGILLLRRVNGVVQLRWVYDEGKKFQDAVVPAAMNIIQVQWFDEFISARLLKEAGK